MAARARQRLALAAGTVSDTAREAGQRFVNPAFVERHTETASRGGQFLAAILLFAMIPVSLLLVKVVNTMLTTFVLRGTQGPENTFSS